MSRGNWKDKEITLENEKSLIYIYMYICFDVVHPQICQAQFAFRNQPRRHNTSPFLSHNTNPQNTKQLIYSRFGYGSKLGTPIIGYLCDPKKSLIFWTQRSHHSYGEVSDSEVVINSPDLGLSENH
jgi:hypothetical protein